MFEFGFDGSGYVLPSIVTVEFGGSVLKPYTTLKNSKLHFKDELPVIIGFQSGLSTINFTSLSTITGLVTVQVSLDVMMSIMTL